MRTRFIDKDDYSLIYELDVVMILDKGAKLLIKGKDYVVEDGGIVLGELDRVEVMVSEVDYNNTLTKDTKLMDSGLSARVLTCLRQYDIYPEEKISVLEGIREHNLMRMRNFGKKSAEELKNLCKKVNIEFLP